jgi:hypothetical protein
MSVLLLAEDGYLDQGLIQYVLLIECSTVQFVYSASYFDNKGDF